MTEKLNMEEQLMDFARYGNVAEVRRLLLEKGTKLNYSDEVHSAQSFLSFYFTLLYYKFFFLFFMVSLLSKDGATTLHCAAQEGHCEVVSILLDSGVPMEATTKVK